MASKEDEILGVLGTILNTQGKIEARQEGMCRTLDRVVLIQLGLIAAMVGVKMLNTDPFLYVATALAAVGVALSAGAIYYAFRRCTCGIKNQTRSVLTTVGWALLAFMFFVIVVQIVVYFRDINHEWASSRLVYILRSLMNAAWCVFGWYLFKESRLLRKK